MFMRCKQTRKTCLLNNLEGIFILSQLGAVYPVGILAIRQPIPVSLCALLTCIHVHFSNILRFRKEIIDIQIQESDRKFIIFVSKYKWSRLKRDVFSFEILQLFTNVKQTQFNESLFALQYFCLDTQMLTEEFEFICLSQ